MAEALAWPMVLLFGMLLFRRQLRALFSHTLSRLKVGSLIDAQFAVEVAKAETSIEAAQADHSVDARAESEPESVTVPEPDSAQAARRPLPPLFRSPVFGPPRSAPVSPPVGFTGRPPTPGTPAGPTREIPGLDRWNAEYHNLLRLAASRPSAAVLAASSELETLLRLLLASAGVQDFGEAGLGTLGALALRQGVIGKHEADAVERLATIRNLVAHAGEDEITANQAIAFLSLVHWLANFLRPS